jgi:negative regulator of flagellin synthesis FlgM
MEREVFSVKINNYGPMGVNPYQKNLQGCNQAPKSKAKADKVEISATAKELHQAQWGAEQQEKIKALKQQIENGTYQIDVKKTAKGIVDFYFNK